MAPPTATETESAASSIRATAPLGNHDEANVKKMMDEFKQPPVFEDKYKEREYLKGRLAAGFRIFGKYGFDEGVAGHITARDPVEPDTFWVNPFGKAFSQIRQSDLMRLSHDGKIIDHGPIRRLNLAAYKIHSAVHMARPDANCAAHSHSIYGRAYCTLGKELDIITQDACSFYKVGSLPPWFA